MEQHPFFSVIIPCFNRAAFLSEAITSVLGQTFADFELIIVDDGSTDATKNVAGSYNDDRIRYIAQEHAGVSAARNHGLRRAQAKYIAFLDSDDRFKPGKLERAHAVIQNHPEAMIVHTDELWFRNGTVLNQKKIHAKPDGDVFVRALTLCCISNSTVVANKKVFETIGVFDEVLPACEDYDLWLRAAARFPVTLIPEVLTVKYGGHPDQLSKKYPAMDTFRIYAIKKLLDSGTLPPEQRCAAVRELQKKCAIYITGAEKRGKTADADRYRALMNSYAV